MQWNSSYNESIFTFANNINTTEGGTHLSGFRGALTRTINDYARQKGLLKEKDENLSGEDVREGLTALISVKLRNPQFEGQTKSKLGNTEVRTLVETTVNAKLAEFLEEHPQRGARRSSRRRSMRRGRATRPARRATSRAARVCSRAPRCRASWPTAPSATRISPSSTWSRATRPAARPSRRATARFQAILPLRGKIINVHKARIDKMLANNEILTIISALGTGIGDEFDLEQARYHKIIIMTDADVDGSHIRTLILTFFFLHMQPLIEAGYVYIAQPPLYRLKQGNQETYIHKEAQLEEILLRGRLEQIKVDNTDTSFSFTETRYQRFLKLFGEYEGWVKKLKSQWGGELIDWLKNGPIIETDDRARLRRSASKRCASASTSATSSTSWTSTKRQQVGRDAARRAAHRPGAQPARPLRRAGRPGVPGAAPRAPAHQGDGRPAAVRAPPRPAQGRGRQLRRAARADRRARQRGHPAAALQGPRRDEPRSALGDDHEPHDAHAAAGLHGRRAWPPKRSSPCSWATRSSRGASSSRRTPKKSVSSTCKR